MKLASNVLHLDTVLTLNKPGLMTYYPKLVEELPKPLHSWDKIEVFEEEGEVEASLFEDLGDVCVELGGGEVGTGVGVAPGCGEIGTVLGLQEADECHLAHWGRSSRDGAAEPALARVVCGGQQFRFFR